MESRTLKVLFLILMLAGSEVARLIEPGPLSGVVLQDAPGFLITQSQTVTQKVFVSLDPRHVLQKHFDSSVARTTNIQQWYITHMDYATANVQNILGQLEKIMIQPIRPDTARQKRFIGLGVGVLFAALGSLFASSMSIANAVSISKLQSTIQEFKADMKDIRTQIHSQQSQLQAHGKTICDTVTVVNLHSKQIAMTTAELSMLKSLLNDERIFMQPIRDLTYDLFRELDNSISNLIQGQIPAYLVSPDFITEAFAKITRNHIEPLQIQIAFHMGTAIPLYVDVPNMELAFLLNLPFIVPDNVYQLKQVINVGTWSENVYLRVDTPEYLAYHYDDPRQYLVPNLGMCQRSKDIHWLCPGKPFLKDTSTALCGLSAENVKEQCKVTMTKYDDFSETKVAVVNNVWLVSTPLSELLVTMNKHDIHNRVPLPCNVCLMDVPKNSIVNVGGVSLFYLDADPVSTELQILDVFRGHEIDFTAALTYLLDYKDSHTVELSIDQADLAIADYNFDSRDVDILQTDFMSHVIVPGLFFLLVLHFLLSLYQLRQIRTLRRSLHPAPLLPAMRLQDLLEHHTFE